MTRVTAPMSKLARGLASNPSVARPHSISGVSKSGAVLARTELSADGRSSGDHDSSRRNLTTAHRPAAVQPNPNRTIPLMQTFHSSAPRPAVAHPTSLDFTVLPSIMADSGGSGGDIDMTIMRVPLLPDNFAPDRSALAPEVPDAPLPAPVISVIAAHPENVLAPLTEVEGMGVDGVELKFVHDFGASAGQGSSSAAGDEHEGGMLRDVWVGLMDDVFGAKKAAV